MKHQTKNGAKTVALLSFKLQNPGKDIVISQRDCTDELVEITRRLFDLNICPTGDITEYKNALLDIYQIYNGDMDKTIEHIVKGVKE